MLEFKRIAVVAGLLITMASLLPGCNLIITGGCEIKPEAQCSGADTKWPEGFDPEGAGAVVVGDDDDDDDD